MESQKPRPSGNTTTASTIGISRKKRGLKQIDPQRRAQSSWTIPPRPSRHAIGIKPDYDFGNNNLGVYFARKSGASDLKLAEKYFRGPCGPISATPTPTTTSGIVLAEARPSALIKQGDKTKATSQAPRGRGSHLAGAARPFRPGLGPQQPEPSLPGLGRLGRRHGPERVGVAFRSELRRRLARLCRAVQV